MTAVHVLLFNRCVFLTDGYSYEREAIESWINTPNRSSPMTNLPLQTTILTANRSLKMAIQRWKSSQWPQCGRFSLIDRKVFVFILIRFFDETSLLVCSCDVQPIYTVLTIDIINACIYGVISLVSPITANNNLWTDFLLQFQAAVCLNFA